MGRSREADGPYSRTRALIGDRHAIVVGRPAGENVVQAGRHEAGGDRREAREAGHADRQRAEPARARGNEHEPGHAYATGAAPAVVDEDLCLMRTILTAAWREPRRSVGVLENGHAQDLI